MTRDSQATALHQTPHQGSSKPRDAMVLAKAVRAVGPACALAEVSLNPHPTPGRRRHQLGPFARRPRVLLFGLGLEGRDRPARVIAGLLRNAGVEVIEPGTSDGAEGIVRTAIDEAADAIGLLVGSSADVKSVSLVIQRLQQERATEIAVAVAGTLSANGVVRLQRLGVSAVLGSAGAVDRFATALRCEASLLLGQGAGRTVVHMRRYRTCAL